LYEEERGGGGGGGLAQGFEDPRRGREGKGTRAVGDWECAAAAAVAVAVTCVLRTSYSKRLLCSLWMDQTICDSK